MSTVSASDRVIALERLKGSIQCNNGISVFGGTGVRNLWYFRKERLMFLYVSGPDFVVPLLRIVASIHSMRASLLVIFWYNHFWSIMYQITAGDGRGY